MKVSELTGLIGREGDMVVAWSPRTRAGLTIRIRVTDARSNYGNVQYLVTPVAGGGQAWVESRRVELEEETGR